VGSVLGLLLSARSVVTANSSGVAYILEAAPLGFWPILNNGVIPALFCFLWLYLSARYQHTRRRRHRPLG
jgi:putative oxidoreductase